MKLIFELLISIALFTLIAFAYQSQLRISCNEGKGWDGVNYYGMATQYQQGAIKISGDAPFVKRMGTPFLVAKYSNATGKDLLTSARDVNLAGSLVVLLLLVLWLRRFVNKPWARIVLYGMYLLAWHGALRFLFYYPLISDIWGLVWFLISLLLMDSLRKKWMSDNTISPVLTLALAASIFIGIFFRESNIVLGLAALFVINPFSILRNNNKWFSLPPYITFIKEALAAYFRKNTIILFLPLAAGVAASFIASKLTINTNVAGYSYFKTILQFFYQKSVPEYLLALFICFGALLVLVPFFITKYKSFFQTKQDLTILLVLALVFGYIGGTDTERIIYMSSFPIMFILIGWSMELMANSAGKWWLAALFAIQLISYRVFWIIPDCNTPTLRKPIPFFTLIGKDFEYTLLYSGFGNAGLNSILVIQYLLLLILTGFIINWKNKQESNPRI